MERRAGSGRDDCRGGRRRLGGPSERDRGESGGGDG